MNARRVVTSRRADEDLESAVLYYAAEGAPDAAHRLLAAFERMTILVGEHPGIGSAQFALVTGIDQLRTMSLPPFPYVAVYTVDTDAVRIHRVLHTSRDIPAALADSH